MKRDYRVIVTCSHCGGDLEGVAVGRATKTEARAISRCTECGRQWLIACHVYPFVETDPTAEPPKRARTALCGTDSGYFHHRRELGEEACEACKAAHSAKEKARAKRMSTKKVRVPA